MKVKKVDPEEDNKSAEVTRRGSLVAGLIILFVGIFFLLERTGVIPSVDQSWPVILVIVGVALIISYLVNLSRR